MIQFQSKSFNKAITLNKELLPKKLKEVVFIVKNETLLFDFFDMDKISVSDLMLATPFEDTNVYLFITDLISNVLIKENVILNPNVEYIFNVGWKYRNVNNYLNRVSFIECRHKAKISQKDLAEKIDISRESIYMLEAGDIRNVRSDMLIKYALYFKKPVSYFLRKEFKEKLVDVDTIEIFQSNVISLEQKDSITRHLLL